MELSCIKKFFQKFLERNVFRNIYEINKNITLDMNIKGG